MPLYRNLEEDYFQKSDGEYFREPIEPKYLVPVSGIYQCTSCTFEVVLDERGHFPSTEACRDHSPKWIPSARVANGPVRWQLVAAARQLHPPR
jgi:hypothetical protein